MKKEKESLASVLRAKILSLKVGEEVLYYADQSSNFRSIRNTYHQITKENREMINKKFKSDWTENHEYFVITRIK